MDSLYGFCISGTVPVRVSDSDASEMDTQILLGECFEVLAITERWVQIRTITDKVEGWVNKVQIKFLSPSEFQNWNNNPQKERSPYRSFFAYNDLDAIHVPFGAEVVFDDVSVVLPHGKYEVRQAPILLKSTGILETAEQLLGTPYLWGGRTDTGLDCSGFVQIIYQLFGFNPPRNSRAQALIQPVRVNGLTHAKKGDLIYFGESKEKISHVGFYLGEGTLLHASGHVKLNNLIYDHRFENPFPFDKRLADRIQFIQDSSALKR
jgi:gamma-D-glutamyl-L-lysine dipeptidyl-peptidase